MREVIPATLWGGVIVAIVFCVVQLITGCASGPPPEVQSALSVFGEDRILYGTDAPFDMGYLNKATRIPGLSRLSPEDRNRILFQNTKRLYKI